MKRVSIFTLMSLLVFVNLVMAQDFYDIETINTIELEFKESNWDQILDDFMSEGKEQRHIGTAVINGVQFDSVGVRYKGNSSYNARNQKNPLNIKLDHIIDDQTLDGYGTLKLSNGYKDPSFAREVLSYEIARMYMPASQANYIWVTINGTDLGLYTSVQDVDKFFAETHFGSRDNAFFKGEVNQDGKLTSTSIWAHLGSDSLSYMNYYELESDNGWDELISFLDIFNNNPESMGSVLNVDRHLWMLAFDYLTVNLDSPINFAHNYYLYQDDAGRFNPIMWDLNENFGVFTSLLGLSGMNNNLSVTEMQKMDPDLYADNNLYPIVGQIFNDPVYWKQYVAHMKTMIEEVFQSGWYLTRAEELQDIIDEMYQSDPNMSYTYNDFKNNLTQSIGGGFGGPGGGGGIAGISELMEARINYLMNLDDFAAKEPAVHDINYEIVDQAVWFNVRVSDGQSVQLAWRTNPLNPFEMINMYDDGQHEDGNSGDGVYGAELTDVTGQIQYYIYAENDDACVFLPAKAEYEYYLLTVANDVVINELMASNTTVIADQDSEYDDWIELYNNSDSVISLNNWSLSDKAGNFDKWTFPDTSIEANGYLIVWADEDGSQEGLHANFKLSADGEAVYLSNSDGDLVDNVSFEVQNEDVSWARSPNGTGDFLKMTASFEAVNESGHSNVEGTLTSPKRFELAQNYPNPFNPTTVISYSLSSFDNVELSIFNLQGQKVKTLMSGSQSAGVFEVIWNGTNEDGLKVSSGIYIYQLIAGNQRMVKKMSLMK